MAEYTYQHITSRIFALNSFEDSWQSGCILTAEPVAAANNTHVNGNCSAAPGWASCAGNPEACTAAQMPQLITFSAEFTQKMNGTATAGAPGNGGFIVSCHTHCEAQSDGAWTGFQIGGVTMRDAVAAWMDADPSAPAADNTHYDCTYNSASPHNCNPSCKA
jgi:hypothetical protein